MHTPRGWISLTFDDALNEHLDNVIPVLNANGLSGTFYTHLSAPAFVRRCQEWVHAAAGGHELGNHTIFHPAVSQKKWVRPGNAIDCYSLDRMRLELEVSSEWLAALDGRPLRTFAYPCSNSFVGHSGWVRQAAEALRLGKTRIAGWIDRARLDLGATKQSYEPIVAELFAAGRGGGLTCGEPVPPMGTMKRSRLPSIAVENWSLDQLQQFVSETVRRETWGILQFHGVGGGHRMDCDLQVFQEFAAWLDQNHSGRAITVVEGANRLWPSERVVVEHSPNTCDAIEDDPEMRSL